MDQKKEDQKNFKKTQPRDKSETSPPQIKTSSKTSIHKYKEIKHRKKYDVKGKITWSCYIMFVSDSGKSLYYYHMPGWS